MPTDGSGNHTNPPDTEAVTGEVIESSPFNELMDDHSAAFTARVMRNGSAPMTASLPMAGFKLTGLGAGANNGESVRYEQWTVAATETGPGRVELATTAEAATATDTARAVTPAGLPAYGDARAASAANILAGTADKVLEADNLVTAGAFVTITPDGSNNAATDMSAGRNFKLTINANTTMTNPTNTKEGQVITYAVTQGTGGSRTLSWGTSFNFGDGTATLSTSEGDLDLISFQVYSSTQIIFLGIRKGAGSA